MIASDPRQFQVVRPAPPPRRDLNAPETMFHVEPEACRTLWCNVLMVAWEDALQPVLLLKSWEVDEARRWFGSRDFHRVCMWAGVDADRILRAYQAAMATRDDVAGRGRRKRIAA